MSNFFKPITKNTVVDDDLLINRFVLASSMIVIEYIVSSFTIYQHGNLQRLIKAFLFGNSYRLPLFVCFICSTIGYHSSHHVSRRKGTAVLLPPRSAIRFSKACSEYTGTAQSSPDVQLEDSGIVRVGWHERYRQLFEYRQIYGHSMVPKRYKENPALGNWVSKQRQHYRNYFTGAKPCSLTERRIELLNGLQFCWNATLSHSNVMKHSKEQEQWWEYFDEARLFCLQKRLHLVPRQTRLGMWLDRQRKAYKLPEHRNNNFPLSEEQIVALEELDPDWWMSRRQWQWEERFRDLQRYASLHGHCCVPISYSDRKLAHWVSNQRKQFNLREVGKVSELTPVRIQKLDSIGFVWNRWEYEFDKKRVYWK